MERAAAPPFHAGWRAAPTALDYQPEVPGSPLNGPTTFGVTQPP